MVSKWESRILWVALAVEICIGGLLQLTDPSGPIEKSPKIMVISLFIATIVLIGTMLMAKYQNRQEVKKERRSIR